MDYKISKTLEQSMKTLDRIADTYGVARATHITLLGNHLLELKGEFDGLIKELENLRKFKEEHTEHDNQRNEVPAES